MENSELDFDAIVGSTRDRHRHRARTDHYRSSRPPRWGTWSWGAVAVIALIASAAVLSSSVRHQWSLSLWRQPTSYTELAFGQAATLPATVEKGKAVRVLFSITNDGSATASYKYVIASGSGARLKPLRSSRVKIAPGATWTGNKFVLPKCSHANCRMQVSLPGQDESIDFTFTLRASTSATS